MVKPRSCRGFQPERMHESDFAARRLRSLIGNPICVDVSVAKSHLCQRLPAKSNLCCCFEPKPQHRFDLAERHLRFLQRNPFYVNVSSQNFDTESISQAPRPSVVARANSREALKHLVTHGKIPSNERIPSKRPRHGNHEAVPRTARHPDAQKEQASNPVEDAKLEVRGRPPPACAEHRTPWMARISRICQKEGNRPPHAERHARGPAEVERRGRRTSHRQHLAGAGVPRKEDRRARLPSETRCRRTEGRRALSLLLEGAERPTLARKERHRTPSPHLSRLGCSVSQMRMEGRRASHPSHRRRFAGVGVPRMGGAPNPSPHLSRLPLPPLYRQFSEQAAMASTSS